MTATITVEATGRTHVGLVRRRNEDALYIGRNLALVADGLGGHVSGDVASTVVADVVQQTDRPAEARDLPRILGRAIHAANQSLAARITGEPALAGMGSTLVALLWSGGTAALANIGDSRAYLLRGRLLSQITEDHTYDHLVAGAERVPTLPARLARYLDGRAVGRSPDITTHTLLPGDRYLLCSDGLSSYVPHELIHEAVAAQDGAATAEALVALALDQGAPDNVTVAIVDVSDA